MTHDTEPVLAALLTQVTRIADALAEGERPATVRSALAAAEQGPPPKIGGGPQLKFIRHRLSNGDWILERANLAAGTVQLLLVREADGQHYALTVNPDPVGP